MTSHEPHTGAVDQGDPVWPGRVSRRWRRPEQLAVIALGVVITGALTIGATQDPHWTDGLGIPLVGLGFTAWVKQIDVKTWLIPGNDHRVYARELLWILIAIALVVGGLALLALGAASASPLS